MPSADGERWFDSARTLMVHEGELLWTPRPEYAAASNVAQYMDWLRRERGLRFADYHDLQRWSVTDIEGFWSSIWTYFDVQSETPYTSVIDRKVMPGARWFEGSRVNYAEHLLRHEGDVTRSANRTVFHHLSETRELAQMSWGELGNQVRVLATQLRAMGIQPGDRIVSYMPNIPETAIAMMATVAIGAVWSSAAPEFGVKTVIERFSQIEPKLLFVADGYRFGGKDFSREQEAQEIVSRLPTLKQVVWLPYLHADAKRPAKARLWSELLDQPAIPRDAFRYERVPCDHPIWVVFSSGTTGLPKAIVHSHVGVLVEHLKLMHFHINLKPESVMFFYTTTGWMMWNLVIATLLTGSASVLYDGSATHPSPDRLWRLADVTRCTSFGASPTLVQIMDKEGLRPGREHDLSALEGILVAGSSATPEVFEWLYRHVKRDLWVTSQSGGTEICSGFVGATPTLPVYAGEIQARMLGMDVQAWNEEGRRVVDEVGELMLGTPSPSMPLYFWNDRSGARYLEAYFERHRHVWRHGDYIKFNERGGCYIYGRSDSSLNRYGVRIGTAEIYRCVEQLPEIVDSLIVCLELAGGRFFMPMFVELRTGCELDERLRERIGELLRRQCSPRHVPDQIYQVEGVPYTLTGKKMELPVRKILMGTPIDKAMSRDAMMNPSTLDWYLDFTREQREMLTG
ncbi:MAG: acetoacetate--CoA ligase [Hydrocarboniphaga sp.]|nr:MULTISPECIES: acetoacetate--CoA ligase [Hydrocarboniphaga]MDZ4081197.1 acetoacetate--CoA ligase [Hydrocarboniphaga sp.]